MVERYASGSSLSKTRKEDHLDYLEGMLWAEFTDEFYVALKKLTVAEIKELHRHIAERINETYEEASKKSR